jgi:hypothetical protein
VIRKTGKRPVNRTQGCPGFPSPACAVTLVTSFGSNRSLSPADSTRVLDAVGNVLCIEQRIRNGPSQISVLVGERNGRER